MINISNISHIYVSEKCLDPFVAKQRYKKRLDSSSPNRYDN